MTVFYSFDDFTNQNGIKKTPDQSPEPFALSTSKGIPTPVRPELVEGHSPPPFALSLSKGIPGFDKLSPNGVGVQ